MIQWLVLLHLDRFSVLFDLFPNLRCDDETGTGRQKYAWPHVIACHNFDRHSPSFAHYASHSISSRTWSTGTSNNASHLGINCDLHFKCLHAADVVCNKNMITGLSNNLLITGKCKLGGIWSVEGKAGGTKYGTQMRTVINKRFRGELISSLQESKGLRCVRLCCN